VEYKRPTGAYHSSDFHKICRVCTPFQDVLAVKILFDLLNGLWSYGGFKLTESGYPQIFSPPPSGETMSQTPKVLDVQEHARGPLSPCKIWWGSDFTRRWGGQKSWVCFVCLSVCSSCFWTSEIVRPISPWRCWTTETILMPLDSGRFVVVHWCSTFSDCCQLATTLNAEVQKMVKIGVFRNQRATE